MHNQAYIHMTRMPFDNLVGMDMRDIIRKRHRTRAAALMVIDELKPVTLTHSNEEGTILVTANPLFNVDGKLNMVVTYVQEITDFIRLHEELIQAKSLEEMYYRAVQDNFAPEQDQPIAESKVMKDTITLAKRLAEVDANILLTGESGVGKDVIARFIHDQSSRKRAPFIAVNCGALTENLLETELFGYAPGAFTGATRSGKAGLFEAAKGGTLFLDEIGDTSANLQVALLRVLEKREITRVGSVEAIPINVRVIAATNRNLEEMVDRETFRYDLFYRLNVLNIKISPLGERPEDIVPLSMYFLNLFNTQYQQSKKMSHKVLRHLIQYHWPGNVRELKNTMERMVLMSKGDYLNASVLPDALQGDRKVQPTVIVSGIMPLASAIEQVERQILTNAYRDYGTVRQIAQVLGVDHSTVVRKLRKYKITEADD